LVRVGMRPDLAIIEFPALPQPVPHACHEMPMRSLAYVVAAAVALLYPGAVVSAQESAPPAHLVIQAGIFDFELDGDGYAPMLAARAVVPVATVLMLEGSVLAARPGQDFATTTLLIPEAQVQLVLPFA